VPGLLALEIEKPGRTAADLRWVAGVDPTHERWELWGAPHIHGELLKLGFTVAQSTVAKHMAKRADDPSGQRWSTFLRNHMPHIAALAEI